MFEFYENAGNNLKVNISNIGHGVIKKMYGLEKFPLLEKKKFLFVGSGVTTKEKFDLIKELQNDGYVLICASTALSFLFKEGIWPNLVMAHDIRKETFEVLDGISKYNWKHTCIATSTAMYPSLFSSTSLKEIPKFIYNVVYPVFIEGDACYLSMIHLLKGITSDMFIENCGNSNVAGLGDTCSTMVFIITYLAFLIGDRTSTDNIEIVTLGCDYGWKTGKEQRVPIYTYGVNGWKEEVNARPKDKDVFMVNEGIETTKLLERYYESYKGVKDFFSKNYGGLVWREESLRTL